VVQVSLAQLNTARVKLLRDIQLLLSDGVVATGDKGRETTPDGS